MRKSLPNQVGLKYGTLTVLKELPARNYIRYCEYQCDCGRIIVRDHNGVRAVARSGGQPTCIPCFKKKCVESGRKNFTHKLSKTRMYAIWSGMKTRCSNPAVDNYPIYGGRGISVCEEWQAFEPFREWALANGYTDDLSIDRIDNNGNYQPSNCRWATFTEQVENRSNTRWLTHKGETLSLAEWSRITGIQYHTLKRRIYVGWSDEKVITTPVRSHK